jgi:sulfur-carrier protein adenylyltransferase/sulfurtransferase
MLSIEEKERYARQLQLPGWGEEAQLKIKAARVLVVGAGALGCAVLQNLARTGVGKLGIADADVISSTNLQRQVLFDERDIGKLKTETAKEKIQLMNAFVDVQLFSERITVHNVSEVFEGYDIIVDGSDNFETKYLLNDACVMLNKPLISGSIEQFEGQVSVFNYKDGPTYRCVFPEAPAKEFSTDCNTMGVTPSLPTLIGSHQANEVIKIITGIGETLSGKLLIINVLGNSFLQLNIFANPENKKISSLAEQDNIIVCDTADVEPVGNAALKTNEEYWLLDVRPETEHAEFNIGGKNIPLYDLELHWEHIPAEKKVLTYCNGGTSAKQAAALISSKKNTKVYYLDVPLSSLRNS